MSQKKVKLEDKEFKIWLGDDGVVRIKLGKTKFNEEALDSLGEKYREITKKLSAKPKILTDVNFVQFGAPAAFRRKTVRFIKDINKDPGFEKQAIWGGSTIIKVVVSFLLTATRLKNIKYFRTEKEALKWLKKD